MLLQHHKKFYLMNHCNDANGVKPTAAQFYSPLTESLKVGLPDFQLLQMILGTSQKTFQLYLLNISTVRWKKKKTHTVKEKKSFWVGFYLFSNSFTVW